MKTLFNISKQDDQRSKYEASKRSDERRRTRARSHKAKVERRTNRRIESLKMTRELRQVHLPSLSCKLLQTNLTGSESRFRQLKNTLFHQVMIKPYSFFSHFNFPLSSISMKFLPLHIYTNYVYPLHSFSKIIKFKRRNTKYFPIIFQKFIFNGI